MNKIDTLETLIFAKFGLSHAYLYKINLSLHKKSTFC